MLVLTGCVLPISTLVEFAMKKINERYIIVVYFIFPNTGCQNHIENSIFLDENIG